MTYARFLALFLGPLLVLGLVRVRPVFRVRHLLFLLGLSVVVVAWTSPWDNAAVAAGLWGFDPERISGIVLGLLPIEEYLFFLLQTWVTSLLLMRRVMR
ncbi:MAG: lycopene cyclase domain-containing protein [Deltaproteobacteria bacterium]|nr:lycopene cyclase domain-containing protein [Deltaproteobacteria bacterium]